MSEPEERAASEGDAAEIAETQSQPPESGTAPSETDNDALEKKAVRGGIIEMAGYVLSQALRLGGNILLTRLLMPEAFGRMQMVLAINIGLTLLSDVGIEQSVIQNEKGDEETFLNTAWTMQFIRGIGLYVASLALTYPYAMWQGDDALLTLLPVSALAVLFAGISSTSEFTLRRRVNIKTLLALDLGSQLVGLVTMISLAWTVLPSVWALVVGTIANECVRSIATHTLIDVGYRNRICWDPKARDAIFSFGKWIFGSSAVFFLAGYGDRLLLGHFVGAGVLGVYGIALMLSEAALTAVGKVVHGVLFPVFAQVQKQGPAALSKMYYATRAKFDIVSMGGLGLLMTLGPFFVDLLWDERYHDAKWMLSILAVRGAARAIFGPADSALMSMGMVRFGFANNLARTIFVFAGIPIGHHLAGMAGVVWAMVIAELPGVLILWGPLQKKGVLKLRGEVLSWLYFGVGAGVGWVVNALIEMVLE